MSAGNIVNLLRVAKGCLDYAFSQDEEWVAQRESAKRQYNDAKQKIKAGYQEFKDIKDGKIELPPRPAPLAKWRKICLLLLVIGVWVLIEFSNH